MIFVLYDMYLNRSQNSCLLLYIILSHSIVCLLTELVAVDPSQLENADWSFDGVALKLMNSYYQK